MSERSFVRTQKPQNCLEDCEAQCCYDSEVFCANEDERDAVLAHNPNARVGRADEGGYYIYVPGLCGCNVNNKCVLHDTDFYPEGCRKFIMGGRDCREIRASENYPIDLKQSTVDFGFIRLEDINVQEP